MKHSRHAAVLLIASALSIGLAVPSSFAADAMHGDMMHKGMKKHNGAMKKDSMHKGTMQKDSEPAQ
jgi:pentapeptide MXKDX repeat protein